MILLWTQNLDDGTEFTLESDDANMTGDFDINVSGTVNMTAMGNATASLYADNETTAGLEPMQWAATPEKTASAGEDAPEK